MKIKFLFLAMTLMIGNLLMANPPKKAKPVSEVIAVIDQIIQQKGNKPRYVIAANKLFYNFFRHLLTDRFIDRQIKKKIYS